MIHFVGQSNLVPNILTGEETILPSALIDRTLCLWQEMKEGCEGRWTGVEGRVKHCRVGHVQCVLPQNACRGLHFPECT